MIKHSKGNKDRHRKTDNPIFSENIEILIVCPQRNGLRTIPQLIWLKNRSPEAVGLNEHGAQAALMLRYGVLRQRKK